MSVLKSDRHVTPEVLFDYLEGALSRKAMGELKRHLESCPACRRLEARGRAAMVVLEDLTLPVAPRVPRKKKASAQS